MTTAHPPRTCTICGHQLHAHHAAGEHQPPNGMNCDQCPSQFCADRMPAGSR